MQDLGGRRYCAAETWKKQDGRPGSWQARRARIAQQALSAAGIVFQAPLFAREAQNAPVFAIAAHDFTGDGKTDLFFAQNWIHGPQTRKAEPASIRPQGV